MTRKLLTALLCIGLICLPALAQGDKATLKMPDGSTRQFEHPDQAIGVIVEAVRAGKDGTMQIDFQGDTMKVVAQGDAVEMTFGPETKKYSRTEFLAYMARAKNDGQLTGCKSNLKNFGTALEMWATDHEGHYPISLSELSPDYLRVIMSCPAHGKDTYSSTYKSSSNPDHFELNCSGGHPGGSPGYPGYDSDQGLIEHP